MPAKPAERSAAPAPLSLLAGSIVAKSVLYPYQLVAALPLLWLIARSSSGSAATGGELRCWASWWATEAATLDLPPLVAVYWAAPSLLLAPRLIQLGTESSLAPMRTLAELPCLVGTTDFLPLPG